MVENRNLQHTSVIKMATEMFGLAGPLNHRESSARSFADFFTQLAAPRAQTDMPTRLNRPPLHQTASSVVAGIPVAPPDEPLDSLTDEWVKGLAELTARRTGVGAPTATVLAEPVPTTQGEAADYVDRCLKKLGL